jgi:thiopurine S-methyltransferase
MSDTFNQTFWENRYQEQLTQWDIGRVSTPLKEYIDQLNTKNLRILIPGAGNAYEAQYLHEQGFEEVWVIDLAPSPLENLAQRCPSFPKEHLILGNFFELEETQQFDLILEQTFFCALDPSLREAYIQKMTKLIKPQGKLVGVLFGDVLLDRTQPPFGETTENLKNYFKNDFHFKHFEACHNSIKPRQGSELFVCLENKLV